MSERMKNLVMVFSVSVSIIAVAITMILLLIKYPYETRIIEVKAVGKLSEIYPEQEYMLRDEFGHEMKINYEDFTNIYTGFQNGFEVYVSFQESRWESAVQIGYDDKVYDVQVFWIPKDMEVLELC